MSTERTLAPGVVQHEFASNTLPPFSSTWLTLLHAGGRGMFVDPGFRDPADAERAVAWARSHGVRDVDRIVLTHTHRDHLDGLPSLLARLGDAKVHVHPLEAERLPCAAPVVPTGDDRLLVLGGMRVRTLHTPGHAIGHLALEVEANGHRGVVAGDLVTGSGGSWIGLPEGDVRAYVASLERVRAAKPEWLAVAHGAVPCEPDVALRDAIAHRHARERATLEALAGARTLPELREIVYGPVGDAARRYVDAALLASLSALIHERKVMHLGTDEQGPYQRS